MPLQTELRHQVTRGDRVALRIEDPEGFGFSLMKSIDVRLLHAILRLKSQKVARFFVGALTLNDSSY
jgi:hypothetical protein